jgi:uncharacterized protein YydD (DUF2326 family)
MKISKLYSNKADFKSVIFDKNINFILSNDHSVGKSTLLKLINFCLFGNKEFLEREQFSDYIFYLEIEIDSTKYITIKRPTTGKENIELKITTNKSMLLDEIEFDKKGGLSATESFFEENVNFCLSKFRLYLTYFLRNQDNQSDVFRLNKYLRTKDIYYKPVISNLLGIDGSKIRRKYELDDEILNIEKAISSKESELGNYRTKESILEEIAVYERHLTEKENAYTNFDFYLSEKNISKELIEEIETEISLLNEERNSLNREISYINKSLEEEIAIDKSDIEGLFKEMEVLFPVDLKVNYESVINFNKQIAEERTKVFKENREEFLAQIVNIEKELTNLNEKRKSILSVLKTTDTMNKFKDLEKEVIDLKTKILVHEDKLNIFRIIEEYKDSLKEKAKELEKVILENKTLVRSPFINDFKVNLTKYGKMVLDKEIAFSIGFNTADNIDFEMKVENAQGFNNSLDDGHTIKKLLCFIFACALTETSKDKNFFKFVAFDSPFDGDKNTYQDGVFNALKELNNKGIQTIITSVEDVINNPENLAEIKSSYMVRYLTEQDKLLGDF